MQSQREPNPVSKSRPRSQNRIPSLRSGHGFTEWIAASGAAESETQSLRADRGIRELKAAAESVPEIERRDKEKHGF